MLHMCACAMLIMKPKNNQNDVISKPKPTDETFKTDLHYPNVVDLSGHESTLKMVTNLFSNFDFVLLLINKSSVIFGAAVVYTHLVAYAESQGISPSLGRLMVSLVGLSNLIGKLSLSALSQHPRINTVVLYIVAGIVAGEYSIRSHCLLESVRCIAQPHDRFGFFICTTEYLRYVSKGYLVIPQ